MCVDRLWYNCHMFLEKSYVMMYILKGTVLAGRYFHIRSNCCLSRLRFSNRLRSPQQQDARPYQARQGRRGPRSHRVPLALHGHEEGGPEQGIVLISWRMSCGVVSCCLLVSSRIFWFRRLDSSYVVNCHPLNGP